MDGDSNPVSDALAPAGNSALPGQDRQVIGNSFPPLEVRDKRCSRCGEVKSVSDFFFKKTEGRYESTCKRCKRRQREQHKGFGQSYPVAQERGAGHPIVEQVIPGEVSSPKAQREPTDFSLWTRLYGRELSDLERVEIKTNLCDFIELLLSETKNGVPS